MKKEIILLIASVFVFFSFRAQSIHKIELDALGDVEKLENRFTSGSKMNKKLSQDDFKIDDLITKHDRVEKPNAFVFNEHTWYLFYYKKQLVMAYNAYHENSRMGSCGDILIYNYYFIKNNKFTSKWHLEEPFTCYQHGPLNSFEDLLKVINEK